MKKRLLSVLLCFAFALTLFPITTSADPVRLDHVDIVFELPKAGELCDMETQVNVKSIKSGNIDLLANGATVAYTEWIGDDDINEDGDYVFRAGATYLVNVKLSFDTLKGYCANYTMMSGDTVVVPESFSATVNGVPATVRTSAPYFPTLQVSLTIEGERMSESEKSELTAEQEKNAKALAATRRAGYPARTQAEADAVNPDNFQMNTVIMDGSDRGEGYVVGYFNDMKNVGTIIMDIDDSAFYSRSDAVDFPRSIVFSTDANEIWLSDKVDAYEFVARMDDALRDTLYHTPYYDYDSDRPFYTAGATVFISESAAAALRAKLIDHRSYKLVYTIKAYSGNDVYAAQKAGASAAKEWCTDHDFRDQITSADRAYTYSDCQTPQRWYYSCMICGKCEYNPNHVAGTLRNSYVMDDVTGAHGDVYAEYPNDESYVGVNAAGQYIYWLSCDVCGRSHRYQQQHITAAEFALTGSQATFEQFQAEANATIKMRETLALSSTEVAAGMFAMNRRSDAKASAWAQSDVNLALNDDLLDTDLLGGDYTKNITRLQFCSVAVRLAETLTGKSITPAASIFTDTNNTYVLKAYAAGITTGVSDTSFDPNGTLTRQQMATFIYRTLRYVEKNSEYSYTSYTSKLSSYTDNAQIQSWAREAMAFMNALDLVKGTTDTTLNPNGKCTIEQAVAVAERSVYAHQIGWYQVASEDDNHTNYMTLPTAGTNINASRRNGDLVWVTGKRLGVYNDEVEFEYNVPHTFVPAINPYTGQTMYLFNRDLRPIRG